MTARQMVQVGVEAGEAARAGGNLEYAHAVAVENDAPGDLPEGGVTAPVIALRELQDGKIGHRIRPGQLLSGQPGTAAGDGISVAECLQVGHSAARPVTSGQGKRQ